MDDVDEYINNLKQEQEMKDYLDHGIYPERLKSNHTIIHVPKLTDDIPSIIFPYVANDTSDIGDSLHNLMNKLNTIESEIKHVITRENNENECPICMEDMGTNNYLIPSCNHKVCIPCFITTLKTNTQMCDRCCLCREKIIQ